MARGLADGACRYQRHSIPFVPLFLAGLFMLPFLIPFFDHKAKADLAEHARIQELIAKESGDGPGATQG